MAHEFDLTLTRRKLNIIRKHPRYLEIIEENLESALKQGNLQALTGLAEMVPESLNSLKKLIKKGSVPGIAIVLKAVGVGVEDDGSNKQAQTITVIAPGLVDTTIEAKRVPDEKD